MGGNIKTKKKKIKKMIKFEDIKKPWSVKANHIYRRQKKHPYAQIKTLKNIQGKGNSVYNI